FIAVGGEGGEPQAGRGEVYALNVDPDRWGGGVGRALLDAGCEHLRRAGFHDAVLWVHPDNARARAFYEAAGWAADGAERREQVLGVDVPEVRYRRTLDRDAASRGC
ncbi:MAG: GNAT family N-acetyltransferase, partial [Actinomycetota bacterium]|nr:GNAT family N-acetyltransferase [Actinomycetota bacterium]